MLKQWPWLIDTVSLKLGGREVKEKERGGRVGEGDEEEKSRETETRTDHKPHKNDHEQSASNLLCEAPTVFNNKTRILL